MFFSASDSVVLLTKSEKDGDRWRKERTVTYSKLQREKEESITFRPYARKTWGWEEECVQRQMEMREDEIQ